MQRRCQKGQQGPARDNGDGQLSWVEGNGMMKGDASEEGRYKLRYRRGRDKEKKMIRPDDIL